MGYYCTVPQCTSLAGKTKNVKFHKFPSDEMMGKKWNEILKRGKPYTKYSKVCSLHFTQADYNVTTMGQWKTLSKEAIPSQNLPRLNPDGSVMVIRKSRAHKYRDHSQHNGEKSEKWVSAGHSGQQLVTQEREMGECRAPARKQDAFMQTDPVNSEEEETQLLEEPMQYHEQCALERYQCDPPAYYPECAIKRELDLHLDDEKYMYEEVKREPEPYCAPQQAGPQPAYYEHPPRPGPELLIAKQNALAAHTQLWQNTMKRPFFYSESPHYSGAQLLHRYEDLSRILQ